MVYRAPARRKSSKIVSRKAPVIYLKEAILDNVLSNQPGSIEGLAGALPSNEELLALRMAANTGSGVIPAGVGSPERQPIIPVTMPHVREQLRRQAAIAQESLSAYTTRAPSPPTPSSVQVTLHEGSSIEARAEKAARAMANAEMSLFWPKWFGQSARASTRLIGMAWIITSTAVERIWPLLWLAEGYGIFVDHFTHWIAMLVVGVLCMCRSRPFQFSRLRK